MPTLIGVVGTDGTVNTGVAANYLKVKQSPGAALAGLDASGAYPLLTFNTPNLRMFKVSIAGEDIVTAAGDPDSSWSRVVRAVQVTSEVFAIFAPDFDVTTEGASTFCFMAPDFNTNAGNVTVAGSAQLAISETGGGFSILEQAIADALTAAGDAVVVGDVTVTRVSLVGVAVA
jgi:hypothetical protein